MSTSSNYGTSHVTSENFEAQQSKALQRLMQDSAWELMEAFVERFISQNFAKGSIKRDTEFDTIWDAAYREGGEDYLRRFFVELEYEARKAN